MLDEILLSNPELQKYSFLPPMLKQLEQFIPENARLNFYNNLKTIKLEFSEKAEEMCYLFKENKIIINTNFQSYFLGEWSKENQEEAAKNIFFTTLNHELLHMASTKYYKEIDLVHSGFEVVMPNKTVLSMYLNEGFTEMLNECLYPDSYPFNGYKDTIPIANILTNIVGIDFIKQIYFNNGLAIRLENAMSSFVSKNTIENLFSDVSCLYYFKVVNKTQDYQETLYRIVFEDLKTILMGAISYSIETGNFKSIEEAKTFYETYICSHINQLVDILRKNGMDATLLEQEASNYLDFTSNYAMYFPEDLESNLKLGRISIKILLFVVLSLVLITLFLYSRF